MVDPAFEKCLHEALQSLEDGLAAARIELTTSSRGAAITALQSAIAFINSMPRLEYMNLAQPLVHLLAALNGLDQGRQVPMLAPTMLGNRPPDAALRNQIKAYAIFTIDTLIRAGKPLNEACKFVATQFRRANIPVGAHKNTPDWKAVKRWRDGKSRLREGHQILDILRQLDAKPSPEFSPDKSIQRVEAALSTKLQMILPQIQFGLK
jgi:hypothetical protein